MSETTNFSGSLIKREIEVYLPVRLDQAALDLLGDRLADHLQSAIRIWLQGILVENVAKEVKYIIT